MIAAEHTAIFDERAKVITQTPVSLGSRSSLRYFCQTLLTGFPLVIADLGAVFAAIFLCFAVVTLGGAAVTLQPLWIAVQAAVTLVLITFVQRGYPGCCINPVIELKNGVTATVATFGILVLSDFTLILTWAGGLFVAGSLVAALALVPLCKSLARSFCSRLRWWGYPTIVFSSADGQGDVEHLVAKRRMGLRLVGFIGEPHNVWRDGMAESLSFLGPPEETATIAERQSAYWAVVFQSGRWANDVQGQLAAEDQFACFPRTLVLSQVRESPSLWSRSVDLQGRQGTVFEGNLTLDSARILKRTSDLLLGAVVFVLCLPVIAVLALAIKWTTRGPAFYAHRRLGRNGKSFRAWKLRSMHLNADQLLAKYLASDERLRQEWEETQKLKSDPRVSRIGRILRATSLDELPQIWNVLQGEMSLVGPRPIVDEEIAKYEETYQLYSRVTPGVTGLWQISGRNHTTYEERVAYDAYYVRNWSLWLDIYILLRTIKVVLTREGAY